MHEFALSSALYRLHTRLSFGMHCHDQQCTVMLLQYTFRNVLSADFAGVKVHHLIIGSLSSFVLCSRCEQHSDNEL